VKADSRSTRGHHFQRGLFALLDERVWINADCFDVPIGAVAPERPINTR
jgi:hypothetical protein